MAGNVLPITTVTYIIRHWNLVLLTIVFNNLGVIWLSSELRKNPDLFLCHLFRNLIDILDVQSNGHKFLNVNDNTTYLLQVQLITIA